VTGYLYFFNSKSNRDATQTYVMKNWIDFLTFLFY
jgi:hypothetical protein